MAAKHNISTVMGPDSGLTPGIKDYLSPPPLTPETSMFKWRKEVDLWVTTVKQYAKGGDKKAKGMLTALFITLYKALDDVYTSTIEEARAAGTIDLEASDDDIMNPVNQFTVFHRIMSLVASDSPTESIRRLVDMMKQVFSCTRRNGESPATFAKRFKSVAQEYINHANSSMSDQDTQNFAMLLLENAKLPADVHSSVVTKLVALVAERKTQPEKNVYAISQFRIDAILRHTLKIETCITSREPISSNVLAEDVHIVKKIVQETIDFNQTKSDRDGSKFNIKLADACLVLADHQVALPITENAQKQETNGDAVPKVSSMLGKRESSEYDCNVKSRDKMQKMHIPSSQGPKANSRCRNCKQPHHWFRDPECVYNIIKVLMDGKEIEQTTVRKLAPEFRELFKNNNGRYKTRVPISEIIKVMEKGAKQQIPDDSKDRQVSSYFR